MRTPSQPIRLVNEQINPLPTLQHPLNILRHDPPHIVDIPFSQCERIRRRRRVERLHQRAQFDVEPRTTIRRERGEIRSRRRVGREEFTLHFEEEGKGDATALFGGRYDDEAERDVRGGFIVSYIVGFAGG